MVLGIVLEDKALSLAGEGRAPCAHENGGNVLMKLDLLICSDTDLQYQTIKIIPNKVIIWNGNLAMSSPGSSGQRSLLPVVVQMPAPSH